MGNINEQIAKAEEEIRQLQNRKKKLLNQKKSEERKIRTHRLVRSGRDQIGMAGQGHGTRWDSESGKNRISARWKSRNKGQRADVARRGAIRGSGSGGTG